MTKKELMELQEIESRSHMLCNFDEESYGYRLAYLRGKKDGCLFPSIRLELVGESLEQIAEDFKSITGLTGEVLDGK